MEKIEKRCVGSHIREFDELNDLILFTTRYICRKKMKWLVEYNDEYDYFDLWFWMTNKEYEKVCIEYRRMGGAV